MILKAKAGEVRIPSTYTSSCGNISVTIEDYTKADGDKGYKITWKQKGEEDYVDTCFEGLTDAWEQYLFLRESASHGGEIPEDQVLVIDLYKIQQGYDHFVAGDNMDIVADKELGGLFAF